MAGLTSWFESAAVRQTPDFNDAGTDAYPGTQVILIDAKYTYLGLCLRHSSLGIVCLNSAAAPFDEIDYAKAEDYHAGDSRMKIDARQPLWLNRCTQLTPPNRMYTSISTKKARDDTKGARGDHKIRLYIRVGYDGLDSYIP